MTPLDLPDGRSSTCPDLAEADPPAFESNVLPTFADRALPFDLSATRILAAYRVPEHAPFDDALFAAVAESAEMTVVTPNTKHFGPLGVPCLNPWHSTAPRA